MPWVIQWEGLKNIGNLSVNTLIYKVDLYGILQISPAIGKTKKERVFMAMGVTLANTMLQIIISVTMAWSALIVRLILTCMKSGIFIKTYGLL